MTTYTHFTSPIRRLADLINHRIVKALLHGQDAPYRKVELEQIGQHIATVSLELEKTSKDFNRSRTKRVIQQQLESAENLDALSQKEFGNVLKQVIRTMSS